MLAVACATSAALATGPAWAQSEVTARRECLQAIRGEGVRGYALENPRYSRGTDGASLTGHMVQGAIRLEFRCALDRSGKVTDLVILRPPG
jgi:hypothetical protein